MICQSRFVIMNYQKTDDTAMSFLESLTKPFPKQKILYCQSSTSVVMKRLSESYHTNELLPLLTLNYTTLHAVFQCCTDFQHQKGTIFLKTGNTFKRLTSLQVHL